MRKNFQASPEDVASLLESAGGVSSKTKAPVIPGADTDEDGATSAVPGVAPSQEVDAMFMSRLESIREGFMSERELLEAEYAADMELLRSHLTGKDDLDA